MEEDLKKRKIDALNDRKLLAKVSDDLATYYYDQERYSDALCEYKLLLNIYVELGLQTQWAACHCMIAEIYLTMKEFDKAIKFGKHHLSVARETKNLPDELFAIEALGRIYLAQGESFSNNEKSKTSLQAAEKMFMEGLALFKTYSKTSQQRHLEIQAHILFQSGEVQLYLGFYDKGIDFIRKAITICLNEDFFDVLHKCYTTKACLHSHKKDYTAALSCFNRALEVASRFNDKDLTTCETLASKAEILCKMSDYRGAKQVLLKAWKLKTPDEKEHKYIESNLRLVKKMCDTEILVKSTDTSDHITLKKLYEKLGDGADLLKNSAGALEYYFKLLDHAVWAGDCGTSLGPIYYSIYQTYKDMGCYNEALVYCEKEYEVWKNTPKYAIICLNNIADILFCAKKPYHQVEKACINVRDIAKKNNKKKSEITLLNRLLYYQEKYGETDKMEDTKAELQALAQDQSDNLESSEDEQSSQIALTYKSTMLVSEDDVRLEDLSDSSVTEDKEVAENTEINKKNTITKNSKEETTLLHRACLSGNKHKVKSLLNQGHPVNIRNNAGWVPLHEACLYGRLEIAKMLINSGADVNDIGGSKCRGTTPLHDAASNGHLDIVQLLLKKGAIPSVKNDFNETPLDALQKWRTNKSKLTKEKEIFYEYICNEFNNLIENSGGVDNDTSESKICVKPVNDISFPSTSRSNNDIQHVIKNYDSDEERIRNQSALTSNDTNINRLTERVVKIKIIKKDRNAWLCYDVVVNENISNSDNLINDKTLPTTSKMIINIQKSQNTSNQTVFATESPDDQSSNHRAEISGDKEHRSAKSASINRNASEIPEEEVKQPILSITPKVPEVGNEDDLDRNKQNITEITLSKPANVLAREPPLRNHKNSVENIIKDTEPVVKTNKSKKQTKSRIRPNVEVNKKISNPHNFQNDKKNNSEVVAAESMLNISKEFNDSLIKTTGDVDFAILKTKTPSKIIKDISLFSTSKKNSDIEDFFTFDDSHDSGEFPVVEVKNSKPALLAPNKVVDGLDLNKKCNMERTSSPVTVVVNKSSLVNNKNNLENINKIIEPLVASKKIAKRKKSRSSDIGVNKSCYNSNKSQDNHDKGSKAKSIIKTTREINDDLIENSGSVDLNRTKSAGNPLLNIILPKFLETTDYIQESENSKIQTEFPPEDRNSLNKQGVSYKTEISGDKACKNATSSPINRNASVFSENNINTSIPSLFTSNGVGNDDLDKDLSINMQKKMKKKDKKTDKKKNNREFGDPLNNLITKISSDDINKLIEPLLESQKSTTQTKSQVSDFVGVRENSINAGNPKNISVKSVANFKDNCNTNNGLNAVDNMNSDINQPVNVIQPVNIAQTSNMQTQIIPPATVTVYIEDELQFISLDLDKINMLTISWLVEEVKCRYYKLKGTCPLFNLMTSEGAILLENEPLNLVLSSPELYTCLANLKASPDERRYQESHDELGIHETEDNIKLFPLHDIISSQPTLLRPEPDESPQLISNIQNNRKRKLCDPPQHEESLQPILSAKYLRPGSLAQPTSSGCDFSKPALLSNCIPGPSSPTDLQGPVIPQSVCIDELELDGDTRQLLGVACSTETHLGPPVHKAVAKSWQEILAKGLQKEVTDQIMESYPVPANCDLLLAPTLNPEVKATVRENTVSLDSSLMEQQKQLGLAISALGTAVNSILLNETSKRMILKPISDACRLLCDIHFRETETRRHNVITSTAPELQDSLVNTVRGNQLFGDNVMEKIKTAKCIQQSEDKLNNVPKPASDNNHLYLNQPSTSEGNLNIKTEHEEADNKRT